MYKKLLCCLMAVALVLVSGGVRVILPVNAGLLPDEDLGTITTMNDFADDSVMVVLTHEASLEFVDYTPADFAEIGCAEVQDLSSAKGAKVQAVLRGEQLDMSSVGARFMNQNIDVDGFRRILCLKLATPGKGNVLRAVMALEQREDVLYAEPNYVIEPLAIVPTPDLGGDHAWGARKIDLEDAWEIVTGNESVWVGIVDTGIDVTHPEFDARVNSNYSRDFTGDAGNGLIDMHGHGTHVAGIIGARGVSTQYVQGVCQYITMISLRVFNQDYACDASVVAEAIDYAEDMNIPILVLSGDVLEHGHQSLRDLIQAYSGTLVCSVGNSGIDMRVGGGSKPAIWEYDNIISVGASTQSDTRWTYSNYDSNPNLEENKLDLFAPGHNIVSCYPRSLCASTGCTAEGHISFGYHEFSGTSQAAPFVTGVAALILARHPNITPAALKAAILNNVDAVSAFNGICVTGGRLNAYNALASLE